MSVHRSTGPIRDTIREMTVELAGGCAFATYVNVRKADVAWDREPEWYASSKIARRPFCSACGTPLGFEYLESERMDLAVGALDHPERMKPVVAHFGVESRVPSFHDHGPLEEKKITLSRRETSSTS